MADSPEYKPYAWRSARSRNGRNSSVEEMQERGRAPAFDQGGNIRGFRSRPGAPLSPRDSIAGKSIPSPAGGGLSDPDEWGSFFKGNSPNGVRLGYTASNPAIAAAANPFPAAAPTAMPATPTPSLLTDPTRSTTGGFLGTVVQNSMDFFKRNGITPTSPPSPPTTALGIKPMGGPYFDSRKPGRVFKADGSIDLDGTLKYGGQWGDALKSFVST